MSPPPPTTKVPLSPPPLADLAPAILSGLLTNFTHGTATIAPCPDLRLAPFHLAAPGLSGRPRVADVGGQAYLRPTPDLTRRYDLLAVAAQMDMDVERGRPGLLLGAGAAPFWALGGNAELMPNVSWDASGGVHNQTRFARITSSTATPVSCACVEPSQTGFGLMANLYACQGLPGPALHITARGRTGARNFTQAIRAGIEGVFGEKLVSLGGVFVLRRGRARLHVMPGFSATPLTTPEAGEAWLRYFDVDVGGEVGGEGEREGERGLVCLSVFHAGRDPGLGLRMEHTHCFVPGEAGEGMGGHYHFDLEETREEVEYEAWLNVAEVLFRIDQPGV